MFLLTTFSSQSLVWCLHVLQTRQYICHSINYLPIQQQKDESMNNYRCSNKILKF